MNNLFHFIQVLPRLQLQSFESAYSNCLLCTLHVSFFCFCFLSGQQQEVLQSSTQTTTEAPTTKQRKQAKCRKCGNPMKGHKASLCKQAPSL